MIFLLFSFLYAFEVEFIKEFSKTYIPTQEAFKIITTKQLTFPFKFFMQDDGYILVGDLDEIDRFLRDEFYMPKDAKIKKDLGNIILDDINFSVNLSSTSSYSGFKSTLKFILNFFN